MDAAPQQRAPGLVAGRFRIEGELGRGGMGSVYAVVDESSGQRLALKVLEATGANDARAALFEREYRALAGLKHPRIVRVFDYGLDEGQPYYTMERLQGADLSEAAPMPWRDVCLCLRDVASILGVLHARRLAHRDLSPRNLWRGSDGRLKLLDFGALAPFGPSTEVVGTPPLTAPEVARGADLDARTDLYSLGALGYWLLTSTHAFPAKQMAALESLWQHPPTSPSRLLSLIPDADQSVPAELDELIASLLQVEPDARPCSTTDVVDALNAIADLEPEAGEVAARGYLESSTFVGRRRERVRFEAALARAHGGKPGALSFEGPEGIGRSRLLAELALMANLSGATVLGPTLDALPKPYGLAEALCRRLLAVHPEGARRTAQPFAGVLASFPSLASLSDARTSQTAPLEAALARVQRLDALRDWLLAVARDHTLVVVVDDLHLVDEESQALLALLARAAEDQRLLLITSTPGEHLPRGLNAHASYRGLARRLQLSPLTRDETRELLGSVFGAARYLDRTAVRLHALSGGRPSGVRMLTQHLIDTGAVRYREGAWALPMDLPDDLPTSLQAGALALLSRLSAPAQMLAADLSVPSHGPVTRAMLQGLPGMSSEGLEEALDELGRRGLAHEGEDGVHLAHEGVRAHLHAKLSEERKRAVHRAFAEALEALDVPGEVLLEARRGLHWLEAGERAKGLGWLLASVRRLMTGDPHELRAAASVWEQALSKLTAEGAEDHERAPLLVGLSVAGYLADGTYAFRHGDETRRVMEGLLHLPLAHRLRGVLGAKLSLVVTLVVAGIGLKLQRAAFALSELIHWFVSLMSSIAGVYASYVDPRAVRGCSNALAPFAALGENHVGGVVAGFVRGLIGAVEDRPGESYRQLETTIARLRSSRPIAHLTDSTRRYFLAGAQYTNAIRLNLAVRDGGLAMADEIAEAGPVQAMQAEFIRAIHHADVGDLEASRQARARVELQAIQLGSAWQAESIAALHDVRTAFWTWDAVAMKRAAQELALLSKRYPSMRFFERDARAYYALMRGRHERARDLIQQGTIEPLSVVGWARSQGTLAAAHNALGDHAEALRVCDDCLAHVAPDDLEFVQLFITVQTERALALAGVGRVSEASDELEGLVARFVDRGPLVVGYLRRAQVRLALDQGDLDGAERHAEALATLLLPLEIPSLRSLVAHTRKTVHRRRDPDGEAPVSELFADETHLMTRVQLVLTHAGEQSGQRTAAGLRLAVQLASASGGFVVREGEAEPVARQGDTPPEREVVLWALEQLAASMEDDDTVTEDGEELEADEGVLALGERRYSLSLLWHAGVQAPVGALVLAFEDAAPTTIAPDGLRRVLAAHLWEAHDAHTAR